MVVYVELSLAENFCMDFTLLYGAKAITKNGCSYLRIAFAALFGACFAVLFPLMALSGLAAVSVKIAAGLAICATGGKFKSFKGFLKFAASFFCLAAISGGMLLGIFSMANISYAEGGGFLISSVPVGIPIFCLLLCSIAAKKLAASMMAKKAKIAVICRIYAGQCTVTASGFYDSGNNVYYFGQPVSIMPEHLAAKLINVASLTNFANITTAAGNSKIPIFTADKIEIEDGQKTIVRERVKVGVASAITKCILHPDMAEVD